MLIKSLLLNRLIHKHGACKKMLRHRNPSNSRILQHVSANSYREVPGMRKLFSFLILSLMVTVTVLGAQNGQSAATMHLKGKVLDSTALPMQSTTVKVYRGADKPKEGTAAFKEGVTDGNGDFDIEVPPGDYYVEISAPDFDTSSQAVKAVANMQPLAVTMQVKAFATEIEVKNDQGGVGIDQADSLMT